MHAGDPELVHHMLTTITVVGGDGLQNYIHAMDSMQQRAATSLCTLGQGTRHPRIEDGVREVVRPAVHAAQTYRLAQSLWFASMGAVGCTTRAPFRSALQSAWQTHS